MTKVVKIGFSLWELMGDHFTSLFHLEKAFKKEDLKNKLHEYCNKFIDEVMKMFNDNNDDDEREETGIGSLF